MYKTALELLKEINSHGYVSYIVGGYPRDLYLNRESLDIDICTNATPKDLKDIFGDIMLPKENYGSVTVIKNKIRFEITTFRHDIKYENNRTPLEIEYINNIEDDLRRRDFTINTLCMDSEGNIIDLLDGKKDLDNKLIKMVGDANIKLKEDALRILRAIRFAVTLNFSIDNDLKESIKKNAYLLKNLSYFRKKDELDKIFASPNVSYGIDLIKELGLDKPLELSNIEKLVITDYSIGIWAQLDVIDKYSFTNNEKDTIRRINELKDKDILNKEILYKYGLYVCSIAGDIKGIDRVVITASYNALPIRSINDIAIKPVGIMGTLNKGSGPYLKVIISDLEYKILHGELENDSKVLEEYIVKNYK